MSIANRTIQRALEGRQWVPTDVIIAALEQSRVSISSPYALFGSVADIEQWQGADKYKRAILVRDALKRNIPGVLVAYGKCEGHTRKCRLYYRVLDWKGAEDAINKLPANCILLRTLKNPGSIKVESIVPRVAKLGAGR